jgi:hypothetical protein
MMIRMFRGLLAAALLTPAAALAQTVDHVGVPYNDAAGGVHSLDSQTNNGKMNFYSQPAIDGTPVTAAAPMPVVVEPGPGGTNTVSILQAPAGTSNGVVLAGTSGFYAAVTPGSDLAVSQVPNRIFYEGWDAGTFDSTNNWASAVSSGGGTAVSVSTGSASIGTGTTANGYSYIQSAATFAPVSPGWLGLKITLTLPATIPINTDAYWGFGTSPGSPTAAAPITDGCGFEIQVGGALVARCYASGTGTTIATLVVPTDGLRHAYTVVYRPESFWFSIDGAMVASASTGAAGPNNKTLPIKIQAVAGSSAPGVSLAPSIASVTMGDLGRNGTVVCDATFRFRCATVTTTGAQKVDGSAVTQPVSVTPANSTGACSAATVTNSATTALAASTAKVVLRIYNGSSTGIIWVNFGGTAAANTAGSIPITPLGAYVADPQFIPADAVSAISTIASNPATICAK